MKEMCKNQAITVKRWMVIALIPAAFALGYMSNEDVANDIAQIKQQQQQLNNAFKQIRGSNHASHP